MRFILYMLAAASLWVGTAHANTNQCREYTGTVTIGNMEQPSYGTACLQPDGSWKIQSQNIGYEAAPTPQPITQTIVIREPVYVPSRRYGSSFSINLGSKYHHGYRNRHYKSRHYYKQKEKHRGRSEHARR